MCEIPPNDVCTNDTQDTPHIGAYTSDSQDTSLKDACIVDV